jgi:O-antigen/teichoic acid export membrane protein
MPGGIADGISNEAGTWVLALTGSVAGVGAYNRAWTLSRRFVDLNWRLTEVLFPTLIERRERGDHHGFDRALIDSLRYAAVGMLLPAAVIGGAANGVMNLFGPGFASASGALAVLAVVPAAATLSNMQRHALYAVDRPLQSTASALLRMAVTLAATVGLTLWLGTVGTALGVVCGYAADLTFMAVRTRGNLARPMREITAFRHLAIVPVAYAGGFAAARVIDDALGTFGGLVIATAAGGAAYVAILALGGAIHERDVARLRDARGMIARRLDRAGTERAAVRAESRA